MDSIIFKTIYTNLQNFRKEIDPLFEMKKIYPKTHHEKFDVVVITASIDEYRAFSKFLESSEIKEYENDPTLYLKGYIRNKNSKSIGVIMPIPSEMGIATASINATKAVINFSPNYLFMVGICAGIKASTNIGDIILAEKTLDYNEVIEIENADSTIRTKFMNNVLDIGTKIKSQFHIFISNFDFDYKYLRQNFKIEKKLKCHLGLLATGSSLLRNGEKVNQLNKDYHNLKGIDMETYGVYKAVNSFENKNGEVQFISIKAVSDYADNEKPKKGEETIEKRGAALYNSSNFLFEFIYNIVQ